MATARRTAAALGILAFVYAAVAGWAQGATLEWTLERALIALACFAAFGFVVGHVGAAVARDAAAGERSRKVDAARRAARDETTESSTARPASAGGDQTGLAPRARPEGNV
jgi:predicted lipid-binding transport protein (Tim44 family)